MAFIPQMEPWFDENEAKALYDYMISGGWVTEFKKTRELEKTIADFTGAKYCSIVSNGTISLTLALLACGISPGDEVIVPDYTMVATANAVKLAGAEVVFCDINPVDLCLDYSCMVKTISPRCKAVMLVTINGRYPENLDEFIAFCRGRGIYLIEDAAQSLGCFKGSRHLGSFGDIGSFSFSAPKVITTGQGGALITDNADFIESIRKLRDFGRLESGSDHYLTMGWNFKFTDLQAVLGIEQMKKLPWRLQRKKEIYALYRSNLCDIKEIELISTNLEDTSPWFIDILVKNGRRNEISSYLKKNGVGTRPFYPPLHSEPVYSLVNENYPVAERISLEGLWLPSASKLTDEQIIYTCKKIKSYFRA